MTTIYSVYQGGGGDEGHAFQYFTNLAEAKKDAQAVADWIQAPCEVEAQGIDRPSLKLILAVLNGKGWAIKPHVVYTARPRKSRAPAMVQE